MRVSDHFHRLPPCLAALLCGAALVSFGDRKAANVPGSIAVRGHNGLIAFVGFSADSKVLTTIDEKGRVQRRDARTGKLLSRRSDGPLPLEHPALTDKDAESPARRAEFEMFHPARSFAADLNAVRPTLAAFQEGLRRFYRAGGHKGE